MGRLKDALLDLIDGQDNFAEYEYDAASQAGAVERVAAMKCDCAGCRAGGSCISNVTIIPPGEGRKDDQKKTWRPGLIAVEFIQGIATVLAFGAIKYDAGNWAKGMDWSRPIDALDRHWTAWKGGEKFDPETGYSHLWHAGCCLMFLVAYEARGIGRDDRAEVGMMGRK